MSNDANAEPQPACDAGAPQQKPRQGEAAANRAESLSAHDMQLAVARHLWRLSTDVDGTITELTRALRAAELAKSASRAAPAQRANRVDPANDDANDAFEPLVPVRRFVAPGDI